jgi:uncharacterized membrane protein YbhN (UPF0104 family)
LHQVWTNTLQPALRSFRDGLLTLVTSRRRAAILGSTVGMWLGYLLMAYIPFAMLGLAAAYDIGFVDAWVLMAIGALGLLVPSPGGLGSYHYVTIVALVSLYGVPEAPAATYAVLTHAAQLVFYVVAGVAALVFQGTHLRSLLSSRSAPRTGPPDASDDATPSTDDAAPPARTPQDVEA